MRITKLEHAALIIEEAGRRLVVDPGGLTNPILGLDSVDAVVLTHEHQDHWTPDQLQRILGTNPDAKIFAPSAVAALADGVAIDVVAPGDERQAGPFALRFLGGNHAIIHPTIPAVENVAVLVNERFYYPGDSFFIPIGVEVDTLAAPAGAPWLKLSEAMDFVSQVAPKRAFGTHDGVLSQAGRSIANDRLKAVTEAKGGTWFALGADDSLDV